MAALNVRIIEEDDVVVIRGLEFPNVIVQGKTLEEAKKEFLSALTYFFTVRAKIEKEKYPLTQKERISTMKCDVIYND